LKRIVSLNTYCSITNDNLCDLIFELCCSQPQLTAANESLWPYCTFVCLVSVFWYAVSQLIWGI